ncbi:APC family permease [Brevibacterium luteolum]|uniref:APC family permease n=1 Tax=Brevibacterium luteolum TaxID=199591 RepID=UPI001584BBF7|nr:APC family permease [Brevibacterium luteolum]
MADLKKSLGMLQLLAFGVAGVVGTSWIYTNSTLFGEYGAGGVVFGLAAGVLLAACVALAYSELTTTFPRAGGEVVYSYTSMGRGAAFFTGWMLLGAYVSSLAFYVTAFGFLLGNFFPVFNTIPLYTINDETVYLPVLLVGIALTALFFLLNWFGIEIGAQVQLAMFAAIVIIGAALVVVGFSTGSPQNFFPAYHPGSAPVSDTLRFIIPGMTFLAGFGLVAVLAEDAKISARKVGRTVVLTVLAAGTFYCLVLAATAWVLPWEDVAQMDLGTVAAFREAGFPLLGGGAYLIAFLGLLTSFLGLFVASSRIMVAMGRAHLLPPQLADINDRRGTPHKALIATAAITLGLGWLGPGAVVWFLDTGGVYLGIVWFMVVLAKYLTPRRYPELERPYRTRLGFLPAIGGVGALLVIIWAIVPGTSSSLVWPAEYIILSVWFAIGTVLYFVARAKQIDRTEGLHAILGDSYDHLHRHEIAAQQRREEDT